MGDDKPDPLSHLARRVVSRTLRGSGNHLLTTGSLIIQDGNTSRHLSELSCREVVRKLPVITSVTMLFVYSGEVRGRATVGVLPGVNQHGHSVFMLTARSLRLDPRSMPDVIDVDGAEYWLSRYSVPPAATWYWTETGDGFGVVF